MLLILLFTSPIVLTVVPKSEIVQNSIFDLILLIIGAILLCYETISDN